MRCAHDDIEKVTNFEILAFSIQLVVKDKYRSNLHTAFYCGVPSWYLQVACPYVGAVSRNSMPTCSALFGNRFAQY